MGLFGFGKKKSAVSVQGASVQPAFDRDEASARLDQLMVDLERVEGEARAGILNEIGQLRADLDDVDGAIEAYEQSLEAKCVMGKASTALVKLYNKKRAEAAAAKDDAAIKYYLDKVNEMLALSKNQLRGIS